MTFKELQSVVCRATDLTCSIDHRHSEHLCYFFKFKASKTGECFKLPTI